MEMRTCSCTCRASGAARVEGTAVSSSGFWGFRSCARPLAGSPISLSPSLFQEQEGGRRLPLLSISHDRASERRCRSPRPDHQKAPLQMRPPLLAYTGDGWAGFEIGKTGLDWNWTGQQPQPTRSRFLLFFFFDFSGVFRGGGEGAEGAECKSPKKEIATKGNPSQETGGTFAGEVALRERERRREDVCVCARMRERYPCRLIFFFTHLWFFSGLDI